MESRNACMRLFWKAANARSGGSAELSSACLSCKAGRKSLGGAKSACASVAKAARLASAEDPSAGASNCFPAQRCQAGRLGGGLFSAAALGIGTIDPVENFLECAAAAFDGQFGSCIARAALPSKASSNLPEESDGLRSATRQTRAQRVCTRSWLPCSSRGCVLSFSHLRHGSALNLLGRQPLACLANHMADVSLAGLDDGRRATSKTPFKS